MENTGIIKPSQEILLEKVSLEEFLKKLFKSKSRYGGDEIVEASLDSIDFASRCRNSDIVEKILSKTTKLNNSHKANLTVLHYASYLGSKHLVETIINLGVDINVQNAENVNALHFASMKGHESIVKILIENGAKLNEQTCHGDSALILASEIETSGCLKELIKAGSDVNLQNSNGSTAVYVACLYKHPDKVKALIEAGANVNIGNKGGTPVLVMLPSTFNRMSDDDEEPLDTHYTGRKLKSIEFHQDVNKIVELLIDAHADVTVRDMEGNTLLHRAAIIQGNVKLIQTLIDIGIDVNERNAKGETALHFVCAWDERQIIRIFKDANADFNIQTNEGDTALHNAACFGSNTTVTELIECGIEIDTRNNSLQTALFYSLYHRKFEIFETLMKNHASIGHDSLLLMGSKAVALHVFKMQHYFKSYRDEYGNTIFHMFIKNFPRNSSEEILSLIRSRRSEFSNYLLVQNMFGQTPLHIAASQSPESFQLIFSNFETSLQYLLLSDEFGNTFIHTFLHTHFTSPKHRCENLETSFFKHIMENDYHNCSDEIKKILLQSRNKVGNTPLHLVFSNILYDHDQKCLKPILEALINAGADINSKNSLGETVLHRIMFSYKLQHELMYVLVKRGAEVNVLNVFGESPIFHVPLYNGYKTNSAIDDTDFLTFLKLSGSNMNVTNRIGQTALMSSFTEIWRDISSIIEVFDKKEIINIRDHFGSNLLHYLAWSEDFEGWIVINNSREIIDDFAFSDCSIIVDELGQLPCDVAFSRGNANILKWVCVCKNAVHKEDPIFYHRKLLINSLRAKDELFDKCIQNVLKYCSDCNIENITHVPFLGLVRFHDEANEVKTAVETIVHKICKRLGEMDDLLTNSVNLSGSVAENTKIGLPDEFDFIFVLEKMSELLDIEECNRTEINLTFKEQYTESTCGRFFYKIKSLSTSELIDRIFDIINEHLQEPDIYTHPNLFPIHNVFRKPSSSPNFKLQFRWSCCKYKNMTIKVDLVPAVQVHCPCDANIYTDRFNPTTNKSDLVMIMFKGFTLSKYRKGISIPKYWCEISASKEERQRFALLSPHARDAYVISKIVCNGRVCPMVPAVEVESRKDIRHRLNPCSFIISSYMLKNCLFYVAEQKENTSNSQLSVHEYVCEIFQTLLHFTKQEEFPSFMFPSKDLFEHHDGHKSKKTNMVRTMYIKLILNILGKKYDFDDISENISEAHWNLDQLIFIQDNNICANCMKSPEKDGVILKTCPRCNLWTYCSDECIKKKLMRHRRACDYHFNNNEAISNEQMTHI